MAKREYHNEFPGRKPPANRRSSGAAFSPCTAFNSACAPRSTWPASGPKKTEASVCPCRFCPETPANRKSPIGPNDPPRATALAQKRASARWRWQWWSLGRRSPRFHRSEGEARATRGTQLSDRGAKLKSTDSNQHPQLSQRLQPVNYMFKLSINKC